MLEDTAMSDRDFRLAVAQKFAEVSKTQQQQTIVLTEMQGALKTITDTLKEQHQEAKAAPANLREWLAFALSTVAILAALASHISLH